VENFGFSQSDMESIQGGLDSSGATGGVQPSQQDQDNYAQATANILSEPQVGQNRSNVIGMANYDPAFAAAFDISRGLDPTNNFGGTGGLAVPSYLRPQVPGNKVLNEAGDRMMYGSPVERFFQEDLTDAIRSAQESGIGIPSLLGKGLDALLGGIDFLSNSKAGSKIEDVFEEERGKEIAQLEKERLEQGLNKDFKPITFPSIERTNVLDNSFMDRDASLSTNAEGVDSLNRPSIAQLAEDRKKQNALNSVFDMLNKDTQNIEIAAGTNAGKTLNTALPKPRDLNAFTSPGYLQSSVNPIIKENPMQGPPRPSEKAPPGFVDIVMREDQNPVFAGTNMSIFGGRDPSAKAYTPLTEAEALASDFTGFTLEPFSPMFEKTYDPRDYTASGVLTGVNLPAAEFRAGKSEPEKVKRVAISSLPPIAQGINALRSDFDISPRVPISMQTIIDGARAVERGDFSQQEMADFLGGFGRYAK